MPLLLFSAAPVPLHDQPVTFEHLGTSSDRFPDDRIHVVLRDVYGLVWLGTERGLIRFDGHRARWYRHDPTDDGSIAPGSVTALAEDGQGTFWVGTAGGLARMDRKTGRFETFSLPGSDHVWSLAVGGDRLWIGTSDGLFSWSDRVHTTADMNGIGVTELAVDSRGRLWAGTDRKGLFVQGRDGSLRHHPAFDEEASIGSLFAGPDQVWAGSLGGVIVALGNEEFTRFAAPGAVTSLAVDGKRRLWVGTKTGLWRREEGTFERITGEGPGRLRGETVFRVHADRANLLWVATDHGGLALLDMNKERFRFFDFAGKEVRTLFFDEALWLGTKYGGLARMDPAGGAPEWFLPDETIRDIHRRSRADRLWVATDRGLVAFDEANEPRTWFAGERIWRVTGERDLWLGTDDGAVRFDPEGDRFQRYPAGEGTGHLSAPIVTSIVADHEVWLGTYGGGLNRIDPNGEVHRYGKDDSGLHAEDLLHVMRSRDGALWIGTQSGGLHRFDAERDHWTGWSTRDGFPDNSVSAIVEDGRGVIWAATGSGLVRLLPGDSSYQTYRHADGVLLGAAVPGATLVHEPSGFLYFGGTSGLIAFDPDMQEPETRLLFTGIAVGGREIRHLALPGDIVPLLQGDNSFSLSYTLADPRAPERQTFAFRRHGIDREWMPGNDMRSVAYTRYLSMSGDAALTVRARDARGREREAEITVSIPPPLWLQWSPLWGLLLALALVWSIHGVISRRETRRRLALEEKARIAEQERGLALDRAELAEQRNALAERARQRQEEHARIVQEHLEQVSTEIAGELHDGPLGALTGVIYRLRGWVEAPDPVTLDDITQRQLPDICADLRGFCGDLLLPSFRYGLIAELDAYCDLIADQHPDLDIQRQFQAEAEPDALETRAGLYRIFRTLLRNVGKHAEARTVRVALYRERDLVMAVEDDGIGFEVPASWDTFKRERHYGLYMAAAFAKTVGATMAVRSRPGEGTKIDVIVSGEDKA
ncbi:sensor histidine kinase [Sulfidibacter corallicola]|uniref:histidine kinase n=1 Tax=Sulfidibacter corallicola TaxID=2818388 RepID=A0A8A4TRM2_SULCO|nr:two-component regulator propeller domain-containing protein [Sulfidibacter corallicola]QTD51824.1 hypothetical protein J3U87_05080 [Sulfidibacter corallicola]